MTARLPSWTAAPYDDIAAAFRVRHVMTPKEHAVCVSAGDAVAAAAEELASRGYDYAPVRKAEQVVGIFRADAIGDQTGHSVGEVMNPLTPDNSVDADAPLENLPAWLCQCPFQVVLSSKEFVGLVHVADLNKQPMRSLLFLHIADAERKLAELVHRQYAREEDWVKLLSPARQERLRRTREETQRGNVDTNLLEFVYLMDLLTVASRSPIHDEIAPRLGWSLSRHIGGINDIRNSACHGVKPLLRDVVDLRKLAARFERLCDIICATDELLCADL